MMAPRAAHPLVVALAVAPAAAFVVSFAVAPGAAGCSTMRATRQGTEKADRPVASASDSPGAAGGPRLMTRETLGALSAGKWRLGNGLELVLMPDASATSVSYTTWFRVGSRDEDEAAGGTGLAHLFEHLMFTQTKGQPVGGFDHAIEAVGGNANAMTDHDFTAYSNDVPPGELARVARLEADRMVNLALEPRQVDNERDVVIEERLGSVEDSVDGTLEEVLYKQSFRAHPYRWPVIGWMKDIKAVTEAKATAFYRRFYTPDNAVVVIAGQIDEATALEAIAHSYGALAPAPPPATPRAVPPPEHAPAQDARQVLVRPVPADRLVVGYPAPGLGDADRAAYELVNEILLGGPSSRLYRRLVVERPLASSARGDVALTRDPGLFTIWVQLTKGHGAPEAEAIITEEIAALARGPLPVAELDKAKVRLETAFWRELASSHGKAELLGMFEIAGGDFRRLFQRAGEYPRVSIADVRAIASRYLSGARSVVVATPPDAAPGPRATPSAKPSPKNRS